MVICNGPIQTRMNQIEKYVKHYTWRGEGGDTMAHKKLHAVHLSMPYTCPAFEGMEFDVFPINVFFFYVDWVRIECET